MKQALEFALVLCLAILVLRIVKLLGVVNGRLRAGAPMLGRGIKPRGSNRFPLAPTKDSESERKRPVVWLWLLIEALPTFVVAIWLLARK